MIVSQYRAIGMALRANADLYHLHDPELLPGGILLRLLGKRVVFDIHEDLPKQIRIKPWIHRRLVRFWVWIAQLFDALVSRFFDGGGGDPEIGGKYRGSRIVVVQNFPARDELMCPLSAPVSERKNIAI